MNTYEYKTIKIESKGFFKTIIENDALLNEYGLNGWKIVSSVTEQIWRKHYCCVLYFNEGKY